MIDLSVYPKFEQDIGSKHTQIYPLIIFNKAGISNNEYLGISTVNESIDVDEDGISLNLRDYGLKLSNIKQSINIDNRTFKISNLSLSLNNYLIDDKRLSDYLNQYLNKEVHVYYKSQSCVYLSDCLPVYTGVFKSFNFDDKEVRITLEDSTQSNFHKDVPISNIGFSENVYSDKYKNKYIPIVYGKVTKAPLIPYKEAETSKIFLLADNVVGINHEPIDITEFKRDINPPEYNRYSYEYITSTNRNPESPLWIYKDNYFNVLPDFVNIEDEFINYGDDTQFTISADSNYIEIEKKYDFKNPLNPPAYNELLCSKVTFGSDMKILLGDWDDSTETYISEDSIGQLVTDLNPPIANPDGANDYPDLSHNLILSNDQYLNTFAQIPDNHINSLEQTTEEGWINVNELSYDPVLKYFADRYEQVGSSYDIRVWCQQWRIKAWMIIHSYMFYDTGMVIIEMPCADLIVQRVHQRIVEEGLLTSFWQGVYDATGFIPNILAGNPDSNWYTQQTKASYYLRSSWVNGNNKSMDDGLEYEGVYVDYFFSAGNPSQNMDEIVSYTGIIPYYPYTGNLYYDMRDTLQPDKSVLVPGDYGWSHGANNWHVTSLNYAAFENIGTLANAAYPSNMYAFRNVASDALNINIDHIYVGQAASLSGTNWQSVENMDNTKWFNIFDDGTGAPYLFEPEEFTQFKPTSIIEDSIQPNTELLYPKWRAEWNGVPIGELNNQTDGSSSIADGSNYFDPMVVTTWTGTFGKSYANKLDNSSPKSGGKSWCLYFPNGFEGDSRTLTTDDGLGYEGARVGGGAGIKMNPHTFISTGHNTATNLMPCHFSYDFAINENPDFMNLTSSTGDVAPSRLTLGFSMGDLSASDASHTITYPYVKTSCSFDSVDDGVTVTTNMFQFRFSGSDFEGGQVDADGTPDFQFDEEVAEFGANLIQTQGGDSSILAQGGDVSFDCTIPPLSGSQMNLTDFSSYRIGEWVLPDTFNAGVMTFKLLANNSSAENKVARLRTDVFTAGIMQFTLFENALNDDFYADVYGRANTLDDIWDGTYKYTNQSLGSEKIIIENPADVVYHFIEKELDLINVMDRDSWLDTRTANSNIKIAFSVPNKINSKKLLEQISKNTQMFPKFNYDGTFGFASIKKSYGDGDVDITILSDDVISMSMDKTPISDIKTLVNVKYKKDYALNEYLSQTGYVDGYDMFGNGDGIDGESGRVNGYKYSQLNLSRTDNVLEFESDYIRDKASATYLRDFIYLNNCNQHTTMNLRIPIKYSNIDSGDVINFDKLVNNLKSFGEDYTQVTTRNGQQIYPYFLVTSVTRSTKYVNIELYQLHRLYRTFYPGKGSLTRMSTTGANADLPQEELNWIDLGILQSHLAGNYNYFTSAQKDIADITGDGNITSFDALILNNFITYGTSDESGTTSEDDSSDYLPTGDFNQDGVVNVVDIILLINYILGDGNFGMTDEELAQAQEIALALADVNQDGNLNIVDVVLLVGEIFGE